MANALGEFTAPQPGWSQYTGHGFDRHRGTGWIDSIHPDDRARVSDIWHRAVRTKSWYEVEWRCWHGDTQTWRRCITRGAPILNDDGSVREWMAAVRDIESDLDVDRMFEREWLRHAQASAGLALWDYDPATGKAWRTPEFCQLYGARPGASLPDLLKGIHPDDLEHVLAARGAMQKSGSIDITYRIVRPSGEIRWLRSKGATVPGKNGPRIAGAVIDVSELMELQQKLTAANRDLTFANEQLTQFSLAASHDLRAPLREVSIFAELLAKHLAGSADEQTLTYLQFCRGGAVRMQRLLDDLLIYAQVAGPLKEPVGPADSGEALEEARANLKTAIRESNAIIETGDLPIVAVDSVALLHLFQNLLANAIKYRGMATPVIQVSAQREGEFWRFTVRDNGIGIEPLYHREIFKIFKRLHVDNKPEGTGIGLSICQKIVERRGGRIWVESEPDKGAAFYFTLPA